MHFSLFWIFFSISTRASLLTQTVRNLPITQDGICLQCGVESACNVGDLGLTPELGRSPGEGNGHSLQYSHLENSMDCTVPGVTKSQTWLRLWFHFFHIHSVISFLRSNPSSIHFPLYISSCLEDALDEAERNPSLSSAKLDTLWSHHRLFSEAMRYYPIWPIMDNSAKPAVNSIQFLKFLF